LFLGIFSLGSEVNAATFYISPKGSDSSSGTSTSSPWKTFKYAIPKLQPGDTLILKDGTYTKSTTGLPDINCGSTGNAKNGTSTQPIIIKAENERQAHLHSDGTTFAFHIQYCSYWVVEGLQGSSEDRDKANGGGQASIFRVSYSSNITLRRLLAHHTNRCFNNHAIDVADSSNSLVEESEAYYFHRIGIIGFNSTNVTQRRNYLNGRNHAHLSSCCTIGTTCDSNLSGADGGVAFYGCTNCVQENNIAENIEIGGIFSGGRGGNEVYGNISIDAGSGTAFDGGTDPLTLYLQNFVAINNVGSVKAGISNRGYDMTVEGFTSIDNGIGLQASQHTAENNARNTYCTNCLLLNNDTYGTSISGQNDWLIEYSNSFGNPTANYNLSEANISDAAGYIRNSLSVSPTLMGKGANQCIVYVPGGNKGQNPKINGQSSNMAGAGKNGADIGANIVYRYQNGILTNVKLWNQTTGQFPCGAAVAGVNDDSMDSCTNVHEALNVGVNGCPIP
jgi:hypothetical protein